MRRARNHLNALIISKSTRAWLQHPKPARVLNVFTPVVNLVADDGQVISIVNEKIGKGPFNLVIPRNNMKYAVSMKDEIILERDGIQVGTLEIAIDRSTVWDPVFSWECFQSHALKPDALRVLSEKNQAALSNCRDLSFSDDPSTAGGYSAVPFTRLMNRARQFCTSIKFGERDEAQYWFDQLCGLGIGLTPQGDDLLTGCLYACWATGAVEVDNDWISSISRSAQSKTTTLSAAWLKAASEGACSGMWHQLLQAICAANLREISLSIDPILAQGFTSGLSTLLGFEVGMGVFSGRI